MSLENDQSSIACDYLSKWLPREIPISASLALEPLSWKEDVLTLKFPLEPNRNHMNTGFGGSLYTGALLVCWSWLHLRLKAITDVENLHIVIQHADIHYPNPLTADGVAICCGVEDAKWQKFAKMFHKFGKGRLPISGFIEQDGNVTTEFHGDFVVYRAE